MKSQAFPIAWTWLHDLEFQNAIRLRLFRREISDGEVAAVFGKVKARTKQGIYRLSMVPSEAFIEAERRVEI